MLTVYGRKSSFNVHKVMWLIGELGVVHKHTELGGAFGGLDTPKFCAMNPHGRVPVVDDNGTMVWESHAILRYLASRPVLERRCGATLSVRPLDGLVAEHVATGFSQRGVLGLLPHSRSSAR